MLHSIQHRYPLWGWVLFIFSAIFFIASSIRADDPVSLVGGLLFLVACFVFLAPLVAELGITANSLARLRRYSRYLSGWFRAANSQWRAPVAQKMLPAPEHQRDQILRQQARSELRFYASTR